MPYLSVANVQDGYLDLSAIKNIDVNQVALARYALKPGDVLFTEGGDADKLGRGCVWQGQIEPCLHQNHVFVARPKPEVLRPQFLSLYARSPRGKAYFLDCAKQTTNLASINSSQLKAMPVPVPPMSEQDEIIERADTIRDREDREHESLASLQQLKTALLSVLLTGAIRVKPDIEVA